jgi:hypothetical protein
MICMRQSHGFRYVLPVNLHLLKYTSIGLRSTTHYFLLVNAFLHPRRPPGAHRRRLRRRLRRPGQPQNQATSYAGYSEIV